jgi:DNA-binding NarL/FixJ family response regulator
LKNVLIVAKTGQLRDGLHALLATLPCIGLVSITDSFELALEHLSEHCPALVLLVRDDHNQEFKSANKMKDICPQIHLLALVTNERDRQTIAGYNFDTILFSGVKASELSTTIEALLLEDC